MRKVQVIVRGMVQGVGFRYFTARQAEQRGLVGWVENREDGSVQAYAEGPESLITEFLEELRRGPRFSQVDDMQILLDDSCNHLTLRNFTIKR